MQRGIATLFVAIGIAFSGLSIAAHHSFAAQYDRNKPITLKGTITKLEWANPHIYFYIDVDDQGVTTNWAIEGGAPSTLYRAGWRKDSAKVGPDTIQWTVTYDDPVYFTRPWSIERTFTRGKPGDRVLPYTCNENNTDVEHLRPNQPNLQYKHVPEPPVKKPR